MKFWQIPYQQFIWLINFLINVWSKKKIKVLLFVDNCLACNKIKLIIFPPDMTPKLQPMDHGVIKNLKIHYQKEILKYLIFAFENKESTEKLLNLWLCISASFSHTLALAKIWENDVLSAIIKNCFAKAGFVEKISEKNQEKTDDEEQTDSKNTREAWNY